MNLPSEEWWDEHPGCLWYVVFGIILWFVFWTMFVLFLFFKVFVSLS